VPGASRRRHRSSPNTCSVSAGSLTTTPTTAPERAPRRAVVVTESDRSRSLAGSRAWLRERRRRCARRDHCRISLILPVRKSLTRPCAALSQRYARYVCRTGRRIVSWAADDAGRQGVGGTVPPRRRTGRQHPLARGRSEHIQSATQVPFLLMLPSSSLKAGATQAAAVPAATCARPASGYRSC
jgi:hypothetical protein